MPCAGHFASDQTGKKPVQIRRIRVQASSVKMWCVLAASSEIICNLLSSRATYAVNEAVKKRRKS
jgi:hypothetical protein